jgi:hypothetical protein
MPLVGNTTSGALTRTRIADYIAASESVTPVAVTDAARVATAAELFVSKLFTQTPTANRTFTTPTGAELGAGLTDEVVGSSFEFTIVNLAASTYTITLTAGASGVTIVGAAAVQPATSGSFIGVFTAANTVSIYRK